MPKPTGPPTDSEQGTGEAQADELNRRRGDRLLLAAIHKVTALYNGIRELGAERLEGPELEIELLPTAQREEARLGEGGLC